MSKKKRQQLGHSFEARLGDETWTVVPTGGLPDSVGVCVHDEHMIQLVAVATDRAFLDVSIHEALHAVFPWMQEWMVNRTATELAALLWKLGYRKP